MGELQLKNSQYNMRKVLGLFVVLSVIPLACYALAGMYDRYHEMMDGLFAVLKTIFVPQVLVSMPCQRTCNLAVLVAE